MRSSQSEIGLAALVFLSLIGGAFYILLQDSTSSPKIAKQEAESEVV
ncbi:MAG: hypothetical protein GY822_31735 [Deltaproteobacteria bacterium]|nr:hypothetical protein [Deltaproteobacteria bacterium]